MLTSKQVELAATGFAAQWLEGASHDLWQPLAPEKASQLRVLVMMLDEALGGNNEWRALAAHHINGIVAERVRQMHQAHRVVARSVTEQAGMPIIMEPACSLANRGTGGFMELLDSLCKVAPRFSGFKQLFVDPNEHIAPGIPIYDEFISACRAQPHLSVAIVFHGTKSEAAEDNILSGGLDPTKRSGQVYGPGEYFSTDIFTAMRYSNRIGAAALPKGEGSVLVFAVLYDAEKLCRAEPPPGHRRVPAGYLVVPSSNAQLPLGRLRYNISDSASHTSAERPHFLPVPVSTQGRWRSRLQFRSAEEALLMLA